MYREITINKAVITEEAVFDYENIIGGRIPKADIKRETEEYMEHLQKTARLTYGCYFRVKYYDEQSEESLMLFFYRGERVGLMQMWKLSGLCKAEDWTEDGEEIGRIRAWLKTKISDIPKDADWVLDYREAKRRGEIGQMPVFRLTGLNREVINAIYNGTDSEILEKLSHIQRKSGEWHGYKRYLQRYRKTRKEH